MYSIIVFLFFCFFGFFFYIKLVTHFYIFTTKKTYTKKQQTQKQDPGHILKVKMTKAKQRYKNPDNIEQVYIQLRFPDYSQLNESKRGRE